MKNMRNLTNLNFLKSKCYLVHTVKTNSNLTTESKKKRIYGHE